VRSMAALPPGAPTLPGSPGRRLALYAGVGAVGRAATLGVSSGIVLAFVGMGQSAAEAALLIAAVSGTGAVAGPLVGALLDRMEHPRRGFIVGLIVLTLAMALLAWGIGAWPLALLLIVATISGVAQPLIIGAWSGQLRRIVPDMPPARVYAVDVGTYNVAEVSGPALVGAAFVLDSAMPGAVTLEVVSLLFLISLIVLLFVPIPARSQTTTQPPEPFTRTLRYLRVMVESRSLRRNTIIGTMSFGAIAFVVIATPLVGEDLTGDAGIGVFLLTFIAIGALIGSAILTRRPITRFGPGTVSIAVTAILGLLLLGLALAPGWWIAAGIAVCIGLFQAPQMTSIFRVRDREAPSHARGMVFVTSASFRTGAFAVGSIAAGALVFAGWRWLFVAAAAVEFLAVVLALASAPLGRRARRGGGSGAGHNRTTTASTPSATTPGATDDRP
jgi:MFS family permease